MTMGELPLPADLRGRLGDRSCANAGLVFDRYCDKWEGLDATPELGDRKLEWLQAAFVVGLRGERSVLVEATHRLIDLVEARRGRWAVFENLERFVSGLGSPNPVENGFVWHHTLGVPYLPGSSLKGVVRAWGREVGGGQDTEIQQLFGDQGDVGKVDFLSAIPIEPVSLAVDVMTPHFAGWDPSNPPGDWMSPTPIPFLVTEPRAKFLFSAQPGPGGETPDVDRVWDLMLEALNLAGVGAKTAVGYGRFREAEEATEVLQRDRAKKAEEMVLEQRRAEARATPEGRWRLEVEERSEEQVLDLVRTHLMGGELTDPVERRALAAAIDDAGYPDHWAKGDKVEPETHLGAKKLKERARAARDELSRT